MHRLFRRLRPQFSLRAILLLMGLLGGALAIWRWPWQEEVKRHPNLEATPALVAMHAPIVTTRVQFRRGWWGERLKYGVAESFDEQGRIVARQTWYDGALHGPETWFDLAGQPIVEQQRRNNARSGPFRYGDGFRWKISGQYDQGLRAGECHDDEEWLSGLTIERIGHWSVGQLHGPCRWQVVETGELLQQGVFELGVLIEWNGQPVHNHLRQLVEREQIVLLQQAVNKPDSRQSYALLHDCVIVRAGVSQTEFVVLNSDPSLRKVFVPTTNHDELGMRSAEWAIDEVLAALIPWGLTIEARGGELWIVLAEEANTVY